MTLNSVPRKTNPGSAEQPSRSKSKLSLLQMVKKGASKVDTAQKKISASLSRFQKIKNENSVIHASKKAEKKDTKLAFQRALGLPQSNGISLTKGYQPKPQLPNLLTGASLTFIHPCHAKFYRCRHLLYLHFIYICTSRPPQSIVAQEQRLVYFPFCVADVNPCGRS